MDTIRFHVAMNPQDHKDLEKLAQHLTQKEGFKFTRQTTTVAAIRAMLKKEKVQ